MDQLLAFFYRNRTLFVFVLLEGLCAWLITNRNRYQSVAFLASANQASGVLYNVSDAITSYIRLRQVNDQLAAENADLRRQLTALRLSAAPRPDSLRLVQSLTDTAGQVQLAMEADDRVAIMPARVINNSLLFTDNYILIDKGSADGLRPGMGVLTPDGMVGRIKACSEHFATVYSFLHSDASASVMLAKNKAMATAKWMDSDYREATLLYLANHIEVKVGDTVVTTGFNSVYPRGLMVGTVSHVKREESEFFQDVRIRLSVDFSRIEYVYVYDDRRSRELEAIQADIQPKKKK